MIRPRIPHRSFCLLALGLLLAAVSGLAHGFRITALDPAGEISWADAPDPGVCTVEVASTVDGYWTATKNAFNTGPAGSTRLFAAKSKNRFHRVSAVALTPDPVGFTNLIHSYGLLETIVGSGVGRTDNISYWIPSYEGGPATSAALSRPHFAMADKAGNIYIADKNSHSILRVGTNGLIHTFAGTHEGGFDGEGPAAATNLMLNFPNGLWVRADGTVYVLDTDNGRVRRVDTNGIMTTLFNATGDGSAISGGRGIWVADDESFAYFCAGTKIRSWTPSDGVKTVASGFQELGTVMPDPAGGLLVCDRAAGQASRVTLDGVITILAGNGQASGGGDGAVATATRLAGLRSAWPVPTGGYLLMTHDASQLWYLDAAGYVHLMLNGAGGTTHAGDGTWFYAPTELRMSEGRSVSLDHDGNIILCESDYGYIRRIRFLPISATD